MNTLAKQKRAIATHPTKHFTDLITDEMWETLEANRFGITPLILTLIACMGGITAAFGTNYAAFGIALIAFPTVICLSLILSVSPMKWICFTGAAAIVFDLIVLLF